LTKHTAGEFRGEDWARDRGEKWLAYLDLFENMIEPAGAALISAVKPVSGERVLDIGNGGGASSIALARAVAPTGSVTGVDISPVLTAAALRRAAASGVKNFSAITADATVVKLEKRAYDLVFSRFGVMFFERPALAFRNLHAALDQGGRLHFACWAAPSDNQWFIAAKRAIERHIELPAPAPRAPGPFAFADPDYVRSILSGVGFGAIAVEAWRGDHFLGGPKSTPQSAADFVLDAMSIGDVVREQAPDVQANVRRDLAGEFTEFATPGGIAMTASAWFVSARAAP